MFRGSFARSLITALTLALKAAGIEEGDEVIVPSFTMVASAVSVIHAGGTPVFIDCGDDLNLDILALDSVLTPKTKAIMPVHIYGRPCKMKEIMEFAEEHNLIVIEDAAEAHGAMVGDEMVGSIGDAGCFSLYANKIITSGEGGIITTNDEVLYEEMVKLRGLYFNDSHTFLHPKVGWNLVPANCCM